MTSVFTEDGRSVPVTVIQAGPCTVVQRKTKETDGYEAVALAFGDVKPSRLTKALQGHYKKAGVAPKRDIREFRTGIDGLELGATVTVDGFAAGRSRRRARRLEGTRLLRRHQALELLRRRREPRLDDPSSARIERRHERRPHAPRQPASRPLRCRHA